MNCIPFSPDEMIPRGTFKNLLGKELPLLATPVSPRENYLAALRGKKPLWLPMFSDCKKFMPRFIGENPIRGAVFETEPFSRENLTGGTDMFGVTWVFQPHVGGSTVKPGNPVITEAAELDTKIVWPDPAQWDWVGSAEKNKEFLNTNFMRCTTIFTGFFERLISLMDFENAAVAMIDEDDKEYVHRFFDRLCGVYETMIRNYKKYFDLDLIEFHDDWGSQRAPTLSLDTVREMIVPYLKRIVDCCHSCGMVFEMHSCGCVGPLTPAMIEAGVDAWAPQRSANDTCAIYETYGDKISIGISCPLPPDAPEEEYDAWLEGFVESYLDRPNLRTPYLFDMRTPLRFRETAYAMTRKKFCGSR